jgi:hypothetical protein
MESVRRWQREGSEPWEASKYRQRADPKTAEIVAEVVKQLAGALGGPHGG